MNKNSLIQARRSRKKEKEGKAKENKRFRCSINRSPKQKRKRKECQDQSKFSINHFFVFYILIDHVVVVGIVVELLT